MFYLVVIMTIAVFSLIYFGVLSNFYDVLEYIMHYINGGTMSPDFGFLSFYFYLFFLFVIFLSVNLVKTNKFAYKALDLSLVFFIFFLMYNLVNNTEFIIWEQFLSPVITILAIMSVGLLWRYRFPETFNKLSEFFKKENSLEERTDL